MNTTQKKATQRPYTIFLALLLAISTACGNIAKSGETTSTIFLSIAPLTGIIEAIVEYDFPIEVLVPPGASVETYELTPKQFRELNSAQMVFSTGLLNFEEMMISKINNQSNVINLSEDIELIEGSCSHSHTDGHDHPHGVDPHIWTSPRELQIMAHNAFVAISERHPDSLRYIENYNKLQRELAALDSLCAASIKASGVRSFVIYHPALTYYARAYGIEQLAIENDGKEPSARYLVRIIEQAKSEGHKSVLYQREFPSYSVAVVCEDIGATAVEIDPLSPQTLHNIGSITELITNL